MFNNKKRIVIFAFLFILLVISPVLLNTYYNFLLSPLNSQSQESKIFVIRPGTAVKTIATNLKDEGLVKSTIAFRLLVIQMGIGKNIQAGDFRLSPSMSSRDIAGELTHGAIDVWVTFPEGLRIEEQAEIIEKKLRFSQNDIYQFDKKEYLENAQEGYMFGDTYLIPKDATAGDIVLLLRNTFDQKVNPSIFADGRKNNLTELQLITLASLIEREAKTDEEKPVIAGILINRLENGIALQVDATVQYAKGYDSANDTWWPQVSTFDYQNIKSSYNTYLSPGLPVDPIANPGLESIKAAANPADTDYFYYLHDLEGNIHYAERIEEHEENIQQYLF